MLDHLAHSYFHLADLSPWAIKAAVALTGVAALLVGGYLWLVPNSLMVCTPTAPYTKALISLDPRQVRCSAAQKAD